MSIKYNSMYVDETYAKIFEPNLYRDTVLVPGVTYTDKYQDGPAGAIYVHKFADGAPTVPGAPGRDFTHTLASDQLITIHLNNNFQESDKLYQVQLESIAAPAGESLMARVTQKIRMGRDLSALGCLMTEGTRSSNYGTIGTATGNVSAMTALAKERTAAANAAAASATTVLASPAFMAEFIAEAFGKFTPQYNDNLINSGARVIRYLDYNIIECNMLSTPSASIYYDSTDAKKTVAQTDLADVNFIMYNPQAFSVVDNLNAFRLKDGGKDFLGVLAQAEVNTGFKVTNPALVRIHRKTAAG